MTRLRRELTKRFRGAAAATIDQHGASLIMVIVFVMVFAIIAGAILDFAGTGFRASRAIAGVRTNVQVADGAIDGAINGIRSSKKGLKSEGACPDFTLPATSVDPQVVVTCVPGGTTGGIFDDQPAWAIHTLGRSTGEGVNKTGNFHTVIVGGVFSSKNMDMSGGPDCKDVSDDSCNAITVRGDAIALGTCTPNTGNPAFTPTRLYTPAGSDQICLRGASDTDRENRGKLPSGSDASGLCSWNGPPAAWPTQCGYPTGLGWPEDLDAQTPAQVVSTFGGSVDPPATCQVGNSVVKFAPGMYTQKLDSLIPSACSGASTWWLSPSDTICAPSTPGMYYFDFPDGNATWDLSVSHASVIGGQLTAGCNVVSGKSTATAVPSVPGGCVDGTAGVQLLLGGQTNMIVKGNTYRLDLCTSAVDPALTKQRLVMYGLPTGTKPGAVSNEVQPATTASNPVAFPDADKNKVLVKDAVATCASATCAHANLHGTSATSGAAVRSASVTLNDFGKIPVGSLITAATLEVTHQESTTSGKTIDVDASWQSVDRFNATASPTSQPCRSSISTLTANALLHTDSCNLLPSLTMSPFGPYAYRTFNGLTPLALTISASGLADDTPSGCNAQGKNCKTVIPAETATVDVDAVVLKVSYIPPGFEASRCPAGVDCILFASSNNPVTEILGTVYAPTAHVAIDVHNRNFTNFARGIVVRTLDLNASASDKLPDQSPISLPGDTGSGPRKVAFTARIGTRPIVRALVQYVDKNPAGATVAGYQVKVLNWEVVR